MEPDLWHLYRLMFHSRLFERAVDRLWHDGRISGEMHLGMGEEAIVAGIVAQLQEGDAMALDHRGTPPLLMRGVDPELLLREFLGESGGLCGGMGGHMHLFSRQHLAASSGIVGASGPAAAGFGLAALRLRPGTVAVAFFGEGALNQGMLMESMNLATVLALPVLFVCKDNDWAITTHSPTTMGGTPVARAQGFGMPAEELDGLDVEEVWHQARQAIAAARRGEGPTLLHAHCTHLEGHFAGDPVLRMARRPVGSELRQRALKQTRALLTPSGAPLRQRLAGVRTIGSLLMSARAQEAEDRDPLEQARLKLDDKDRLKQLDFEVAAEIQGVFESVLGPGWSQEGSS